MQLQQCSPMAMSDLNFRVSMLTTCLFISLLTSIACSDSSTPTPPLSRTDGGMVAPSGIAIEALGDKSDDMVVVCASVTVGH